MIPQVVTRKIIRWICNSVRGRVWAPQAVCLWIHQSTPNQILLHRRLSPHCPDISHSVWLQGVQDKVKGLRFSDQAPPPPCPYPKHHPFPNSSPNPGQDQPHFPHPVSPKPQAIHFFCFCFFDNAILKALCLVIPLCEHVNDNLLQKC